MLYTLRQKSPRRPFLSIVLISLLCVGLPACGKSDEGVPAYDFVGNWYLSTYMEDVNGNRANDDPKVQLQPYEYYTLSFQRDNKLAVHSQQTPSAIYDFNYDWSVTSDYNVVLNLTETTPSGTNRYRIDVAALSNNTLVLVHDNYNTVPALRFLPPHSYSTNWLIFTRQ